MGSLLAEKTHLSAYVFARRAAIRRELPLSACAHGVLSPAAGYAWRNAVLFHRSCSVAFRLSFQRQLENVGCASSRPAVSYYAGAVAQLGAFQLARHRSSTEVASAERSGVLAVRVGRVERHVRLVR